MRFLIGFILGLFFASVFSGCATTQRVGNCRQPPDRHEGYTLVACQVKPTDWNYGTCIYVKPGPVPKQFRVIESKACGAWEVTKSGVK